MSPLLAVSLALVLSQQGGTNGTITLPPTGTTIPAKDPVTVPITSLDVRATTTSGYLAVVVAGTTLYYSVAPIQMGTFYGMMSAVCPQKPVLSAPPVSHPWTPLPKGTGLLVSSGMPSYRGSVAVAPCAWLTVPAMGSVPAARYLIPVASMNQIVTAFGAALPSGLVVVK